MFPTTLPHNRALLLSIAPTLSCRSCQEVSGFAPGKRSRNASKKSFRDKKKKKHARILVESQVRIKEKGKESCYATSQGDRETAVFLIPAVDLSSSHHPKLSKQRTVCYFRVFRQLVQMGLWKSPPAPVSLLGTHTGISTHSIKQSTSYAETTLLSNYLSAWHSALTPTRNIPDKL